MTNIKDALEPFARIPLAHTDDIDDSATVFEYEGGAIHLGDLRRVHQALASLEGDAVERVARIIEPATFDKYDAELVKDRRAENGRRWAEVCHGASIHRALTKARVILATGLVAGEAAPVPADPLDDLVARFSAALLEKLKAAREKYSYGDEGWRDDDWMEECQIKLISHLVKGDPRDVAAYCAFMWHHGWSTVAPDDELNGCREALRKATVKNAQNEAKISDLNDMVLRYMHRAEIRESAIRADEREKCAKVADEHTFGRDIDWWLSATKKDVSAEACRSVAAAIRSGDVA